MNGDIKLLPIISDWRVVEAQTNGLFMISSLEQQWLITIYVQWRVAPPSDTQMDEHPSQLCEVCLIKFAWG